MVQVKAGGDRRTFMIDDGTGEVQASVFHLHADGSVSQHYRAELGDMVVITGKIGFAYKLGSVDSSSVREVRVRTIRRLLHEDELRAHKLHTTRLHKEFYRRPLSAWIPGVPEIEGYDAPADQSVQLISAPGASPAQEQSLSSVQIDRSPPADSGKTTAAAAKADVDKDDLMWLLAAKIWGVLQRHHQYFSDDDGSAGSSRSSATLTRMPTEIAQRTNLAAAVQQQQSTGSASRPSSPFLPLAHTFSAKELYPYLLQRALDDGGDMSLFGSSEEQQKRSVCSALESLLIFGRLFKAPAPPPANQLEVMRSDSLPSTGSFTSGASQPARKRARYDTTSSTDTGAIDCDTRFGVLSDQHVIRPAVLALLRDKPATDRRRPESSANYAPGSSPVWSYFQLLDALRQLPETARLSDKALTRVLQQLKEADAVVLVGPSQYALETA